jgi:hypothetical protein
MEHNGNFGLAALGKAGGFTVEILSRPDSGWSVAIESPGWCFEFEITRPGMIAALAAFLCSHNGRTEFADLVVGVFGEIPVRVVKDDEGSDRFFLRAAGDGSLVEFTLVGEATLALAAAVAEAAAEFEDVVDIGPT